MLNSNLTMKNLVLGFTVLAVSAILVVDLIVMFITNLSLTNRLILLGMSIGIAAVMGSIAGWAVRKILDQMSL